MALDLTELIETSLATGGINTVDLVRIKLSPTNYLYWSSKPVPGSLTGEGWNYNPVIMSMDPLPFVTGFQDSTISLKFENTKNIVKNKGNQGVLWQGCEVAVCRLFPSLASPDNRIGTWAAPYWWGWISQAPTYEVESTMKISAGFQELSRPSLRTFDRTCNAILGTEHFPYDPLGGIGLPEDKVSGIATGGTAKTLTTAATLTDVTEGWLIFVKTKKIIGRVASVVAGTVTVNKWQYAGADTALIPANAESFICGPVYNEYDGTQESCMNMGMRGPNKQQALTVLNVDTRNYFTGLTATGNAFIEPSSRSVARSLYSSVEGEGTDGVTIPVRVGKGEWPVIPIAWGFVADYGFIHFLGVVGEGRMGELFEPKLDGIYSTDNINVGTDAWDDSFVVGGVMLPGGNVSSEATAVAAGEITESQQMQAIGSRGAYAAKKGIETNSYLGIPHAFNAVDGSGVSLGCLTWVRARFQKEGFQGDAAPVVKIRGEGIKILKANGTWVTEGTVIDMFYYFMRNQLWGAGMSAEKFITADVTAESVIAAGNTTPGTSVPRTVTGVVTAGPAQIVANPVHVLPPSVVMLPLNTIPDGFTVSGLRLTIITGTTEYTFNVYASRECPAKWSFRTDADNGYHSLVNITTTGLFLILDEEFTGEIPEAGDAFYLHMEGTSSIAGNMKYAANGSLIKGDKVGLMAQKILDNCNGSYYQKNGKMVPVIRREVSMTSILAKRIFADKGPNRNVIAPGGNTTFTFTPAAAKEIPTAVTVEYTDMDQRHGLRRVTIRSLFAERRLREITGEEIRDRKTVILSLNLTGSIDQAVLLGTLYLREHSFIEEISSYHPGKYSLKVPIHYAQDVEPMDVHRISGRNFPDWCRYMRITAKKDDHLSGVIELAGMPYLDVMYNYKRSDFVVIPGPAVTDSQGGDPLSLIIASLTETGFRDSEGVRLIELEGVITLPS